MDNEVDLTNTPGMEKIKTALKDAGKALSATEIAKRAGISRNYAQHLLKFLLLDGSVVYDKDENGKPRKVGNAPLFLSGETV